MLLQGERTASGNAVRRTLKTLIDGAVVATALVVAVLLRFEFRMPAWVLDRLALTTAVAVGVTLLVLRVRGAHRHSWRYADIPEVLDVLRAAGAVALVESAIWVLAAATPPGSLLRLAALPRSVIVIQFLLAAGGLCAVRLARRLSAESEEAARSPLGAPRRRVLLLGVDRGALLFARSLLVRPDLPLRPVGFVTSDEAHRGQIINGLPVVDGDTALRGLSQAYGHDLAVVLAVPPRTAADEAFVASAARLGVPSIRLSDVDDALAGITTPLAAPPADAPAEARLRALATAPLAGAPATRAVKRAFDVVFAAVALTLLSPVLVGIGLAVGLSSPGPALYGQTRVGRGGRLFRCWKFRTMVSDAEHRLRMLLEADPRALAEFSETQKLRVDPRVTWIGRLLRRTSLDELPQFWNVLKGDMSIVGPRPVVEDEIERYGDAAADYLSVRPGITGLWQVSGRNHTTYEKRVAFDRRYVRNMGLLLDLRIVGRTVGAMGRGDGAY